MSAGVYFGLLNKQQKQDVIRSIAKTSAKRFDLYKQAVKDAFNFRKLDAEERLIMYQMRPPEVWGALGQYSPQLVEEQKADWQDLEFKRLNKTISAFNPFTSPDIRAAGGLQLPPPDISP